MKKFAQQIEDNMSFLLGGQVSSCINKDDAIGHLSKARNLLENAGYTEASSKIDDIIKKASTEDDSDIEVSL